MKAFECKQCGVCCYGRGGILVGEKEIRDIAAFLGITMEFFQTAYCENINGALSITTGADGYCVFFDRERLCLIHRVKPEVCRLWPFYPALVKDKGSWQAAMDACPGLNPDASYEDFLEQAGT